LTRARELTSREYQENRIFHLPMIESNPHFNQQLHERILILLYQKEFRQESVEFLNQLIEDDCEAEGDYPLADAPLYLTTQILSRIPEIDSHIQEFLENWSFDRIMVIDKESLRIGIYELLYQKDMEPKIIIDRLVRLSKKFGGENSGKFVNGILGAVFRKYIEIKDGIEKVHI